MNVREREREMDEALAITGEKPQKESTEMGAFRVRCFWGFPCQAAHLHRGDMKTVGE